MRNAKPRIAAAILLLAGCASGTKYQDKTMDFASVRTVAVLPFLNLSQQPAAAERVRDVFSNMLLATGALYVLPAGETQRSLTRAGVTNAAQPSKEEAVSVGKALATEAIITGVVKEYGEVRSGSSSGNIISLSVEMIETQTGRVVWSASSTRGGVTGLDRMFGGGGAPMNYVTEDAVRDLLDKLFH